MRRLNISAVLLATATAGLGGCDFLDPTSVTNPTVTEETFLGTARAATVWTNGVERQLASTVGTLIMGTENVSDNVMNNRTLYSKVFDFPLIEPADADVTNIQESIHRLRSMADAGLNTVVPADPGATDELKAQLHFFRGYAHLLAAENFVALPGETNGPALSGAENAARAVADFEQARALSTVALLDNSALLAIARAHYLVGNPSAAVAAAATIKSSVPELLRQVRYDAVGGPGNPVQTAIYESAQGEYQPLPRLDFLFPKYFSSAPNDLKPIAILKGEEAFLILAEAQIAEKNLAAARTTLDELVDLVARRPTALVNDRIQQRGRNGGTWVFPNDSSILVAASPGETPREGLVLTRSGDPIRVPTVSGTSVSKAMLAAATTEEQLLELLYLMRQEIFVVEGRRMSDLGIRFPVAQREADLNPNIEPGDPALTAQLPSFIPRDRGLDLFTYKHGDKLAVIQNNMNKVLVENRNSPTVLPFH